MAQFMLLLRDTEAPKSSFTPESAPSIIEEYKAWSRRMGELGHKLEGNKLGDDAGRIARVRDGRVVVADGPFAEADEVIGGYWIFQADGYAAIERLVQDCPHLKYGGTIEIRRIDFV